MRLAPLIVLTLLVMMVLRRFLRVLRTCISLLRIWALPLRVLSMLMRLRCPLIPVRLIRRSRRPGSSMVPSPLCSVVRCDNLTAPRPILLSHLSGVPCVQQTLYFRCSRPNSYVPSGVGTRARRRCRGRSLGRRDCLRVPSRD